VKAKSNSSFRTILLYLLSKRKNGADHHQTRQNWIWIKFNFGSNDSNNTFEEHRRNYDIGADKIAMQSALAACQRQAGQDRKGEVNFTSISQTFGVGRQPLSRRFWNQNEE
jgi:hypothetical protein